MTERRRPFYVSLRILVATLWMVPVIAMSQQNSSFIEVKPPVISAANISEIETLSSFSAISGPLRLRDASNEVDIFVPLSETVEMVDAILTLSYINSIALLSERSVLSVRFNEATIAQVPLSAELPQGTARVRLPQQLWKPGFNKLTLSVTQHYTDRCEDPEAPELWTEIDIGSSKLEVTYKYSDINYRLSDLSQLVSPGFGGFETVRVLTAAEAASELIELALPLAVQALALRRGYLPLSVETGDLASLDSVNEPTESRSNSNQTMQNENGLIVLVGTIDDLGEQLRPEERDRIDGPSLIVRGSKGTAQLLVTGRDFVEVVSAARKLVLLDDNLNPSNYVTFSLEDAGSLYTGKRRELIEGMMYTFAELGVNTHTLGGSGPSEVVLPLPIPPDFYTYEGAEGELLLNFNYTAGMGPGSIFGVSINGEFIHGLALDVENGTAFRNYRIIVPGRLLRPGDNEITLGFNMRPLLSGGECTSIRGQYVGAQVIGDSQFRMPPGGSAMVLPDFSLLAKSGVPFGNRDASGDPVEVYVTTPALNGAALTLIGKIAQTAGFAEPNVQLKSGIPETTMNNAFVIAAQGEIPPRLFGEWPVVVGETSRWPYSAMKDLNAFGVENRDFGLDRILKILFGEDPSKHSVNEERLTTFRQQGELGDLGIFAAFRNPWSETYRTIALLSAADHETLVERVETLVAPGVWGQMRGDFVSWNAAEQVFVTSVSRSEVVAPDDFWLRVRLVLSLSPQLWLIAAAFTLLLFVISATFLIRRRIKRLAELT
jgi:hypothetical protein